MIAALAVDIGRPVALDTLVHRLWDDAPPAKPRASLHSYATRIRRRLHAADGSELGRLVQQAHTYTLVMRPEQVDSLLFQQLSTQARALSDSGDDGRALSLLRQADALWRGDPLSGLTGLWAEGVRANLVEKRLAATLTRTDIELRLGHHAALIPDLATLFERYPTDETVAGQLMVASYGCGRMADALRTYDMVRHRLSEQFGSDPGEALTQLYRHILNRAPLSELLSRPEPAQATPHSLPSHGDLVGRERELLAMRVPPEGGTVIALQTISGMAGVGKTHLAVHAAQALGHHYPDGQIYLDLGAHSPGRRPLRAQSALLALLKIFGIPVNRLPDTLAELVSLWRTLVSTRRALIVLDDAVDEEQIRPLLPGPSASLVIITSRRRLTGLPGVRSLFLDVLPTNDASRLFRQLAGEGRTHDSGEVAEIVRLCGHLPLAVEIAAGRLVSRPSWTTAHLIEKLSREHGRLGEIRDGYREITGVFEMSYNTLPADQRIAFRKLSRHLGQDFGPHAAAVLTGRRLDSVERILDALLDAHLIQEPVPERYRFHDLVGEYARTLDSANEDRTKDQDDAILRVIDFYAEAAEQADLMIFPRRQRREPLRPPAYSLPEWPDAASARAWLAHELAALITAERHARTHGHARAAARLAHALAGFLDETGDWTEARHMHEPAAQYWHGIGDRRAEALALIDLGTALSRASRYEPAFAAARSAVEVADTLHDPAMEAEARHLLGIIHWHCGRLDHALATQYHALERRMRTGDPFQLARARNNIGITHLFLGNHAESLEYFESALSDFRREREPQDELRVLNNLSDLYSQTGDQESARRLLRKVLANPGISESPLTRATSQVNLANTMNAGQELDEALRLYQDALRTFNRIGDRRSASGTLHRMGITFETVGDDHRAATHHARSLDLATDIGAAHERMLALRSLGTTEGRLGLGASAAERLTEALAVAHSIRAAEEAARIQADLDALHTESP